MIVLVFVLVILFMFNLVEVAFIHHSKRELVLSWEWWFQTIWALFVGFINVPWSIWKWWNSKE